MYAAIATEAGRGDWPNEDYAAVSARCSVLLDGVTSPRQATGCRHGVAWYARALGTSLLALLDAPERRSLPECLATAITSVAAMHEHTCDLTNPASPSSTVIAVRLNETDLEYLVLADSTLLLDLGHDRPTVVTDSREEHAVRHRRRLAVAESGTVQSGEPGGYYVARTEPEAAYEAITGTAPLTDLRSLALLSDGATRLVDTFALLRWSEVRDQLARDDGPARLIRGTREAERGDPHGVRWRRGKTHDDATVIYVTPPDEP